MRSIRFAAIALVLIGVAALTVTPVLAAKGGNGHGNGNGLGNGKSTVSATLVPSCNPCPAGTVVHFSGSGYDVSQGKTLLNINGAVTSTRVYSDGTVSFDWPYFNVPGSYSVEAYQHQGKKLVLKAQVTVVIQ